MFLEMVSLCESFVTGSARVGESLDVGLSMAPQVEPESNICWGDSKVELIIFYGEY